MVKQKKKEVMTPWGLAQNIEEVATGIIRYDTASHGGYFVSPELNKRIPKVLRKSTFCQNGMRGWYEEDCDWAIVVAVFHNHFHAGHVIAAHDTLERFHAEAWIAYKNM